ncbi:alpha/beta hydrolase [Streptomyces sp. NPDC048638]|uniref:alpha/beta hydrolase n=1 Tax=Streptomyces sp. NPDC048638 TaxID=3365580 RepID=UPI00371F9BE2
MSLTGTPFFLTSLALVILAVVLPLALWGRIPGPPLIRGAARLTMLLFAQITAITVVFVLVNNANNLYDTWGDLLGTDSHVQAAQDLGPDGMGGRQIKNEPRQLQRFRPAEDPRMGSGVRMTDLTGRISGVSGEVYVWLPPQYDDPAYRNKKFPVVELLPGYPGSAKAWFGSLNVGEQLRPMMQRGEIKPFILVAPRTNILTGADTGCVNLPGKANADSWLTVDVRKMVIDNFRAGSAPDSWSLAGYSAGAHCAAKLALSHPDRYRAAVAMSGYNDPALEPDSLAGKDPVRRVASNPLHILKAANTAGRPPRTALYVSGAPGDGYQTGLALRQFAQRPTTVTVRPIAADAGGHTTPVWRNQVPEIFRWLGGQVRA